MKKGYSRFYVPKSDSKLFQRDMKRKNEREKRNKLRSEFRRSMMKLDDKSKRIKYVVGDKNVAQQTSEKKQKFRDSIEKHTIDHNKVHEECKKKEILRIDQAISIFLQRKEVNIGDIGITHLKGGKIQIDYIDKDGNPVSESFTNEELLNMAQEFNGDQQE